MYFRRAATSSTSHRTICRSGDTFPSKESKPSKDAIYVGIGTTLVYVLFLIYSGSGPSISSGRTSLSKVSPSRNPNANVASRRVVPSLCAFFAHLATSKNQRDSVVSLVIFGWALEGEGRTVVAESTVQDGGEHKGLVQEFRNSVLVGCNPYDAVVGERSGTCSARNVSNGVIRTKGTLAPSERRRIDWSKFLIKTGLKTLSLKKWPGQNQYLELKPQQMTQLTSNCPFDPATEIVILFPIT